MNLTEFLKKVSCEEEAIIFLNSNNPEIDFYDAEIYLKESISIDSQIAIFDGEKIEGFIEMYVEDEKYYNLFTLDLLLELYEDFSTPNRTVQEIAEKIIEYRIMDA